MSAAIDVSSSSANLDFSQPIGESDGPRAVSTYRPALGAVTDVFVDALILQQLLYLTATRDANCLRASAGYLARPLNIPRSTVADALGRLREAGYIEARQPEPGRACRYRINFAVLIDALEEAGYPGATRAQLLGRPSPTSTDSGGDETRQPSCRDSSGGGCRDSSHKEQPRKEKNKDHSGADGYGREADQEHSDASTATTPNHPLDKHILKIFDRWAVSAEQAQTIRETLSETFGLSDYEIREYVAERAADFAGRPRELSRREVVRYTTARQDLVERGYIDALRPVSTSTADTNPTDPEDKSDQRLDEYALNLFNDGVPLDEAESRALAEAREKGWTIPDDWKEPTDE